MAYFIQLDADKNFAKPLIFMFPPGHQTFNLPPSSAVASQDGGHVRSCAPFLNNEVKPYSVTGFQRPYQLP